MKVGKDFYIPIKDFIILHFIFVVSDFYIHIVRSLINILIISIVYESGRFFWKNNLA